MSSNIFGSSTGAFIYGATYTTGNVYSATNPAKLTAAAGSGSAPNIAPPDAESGGAIDILAYIATVENEVLDPCLSCPGTGTSDGSDNCVCDCAFLPSLEVLLAVVEKFRDAVIKFYSSDTALSPLVTRYTAQARMNDYTRARFLWIDSHPNTVFDLTNMSHRYALRDIYLAYRLVGMELDPVVNTLG